MCKATGGKGRVGLGSLDGRSCIGEVVLGGGAEVRLRVWVSQVS